MRILLPLSLFAAGCLSQVAPVHPAAQAVPDDTAVQHLLATASYRNTDFVRVNRAPYPSALTDAEPIWVNVYVSAADAPEYEQVRPETTHQNMTMPAGMVVVREVENQAGQTLKLTVMVRHQDGWFADGGDFLFGVTDLAGAPTNDPHGGGPEWGKLTACGTCHEQRAGDGWVFGVPAAMR
jgi:hypothetical protein